MKKIFRYVLLLILLIVVVRVYVYFITKTYYKDMNNYEIITNNPVDIQITESKVAKNKGYIKGKATNNTRELVNNLKIKFDFYNEQGKYVGSEYKKIEYFNATETIKFDIKYEYQNVEKINISTVNDE